MYEKHNVTKTVHSDGQHFGHRWVRRPVCRRVNSQMIDEIIAYLHSTVQRLITLI